MPNSNLPARPLFGGLTATRDERALEKQLRALYMDASLELAQVHTAEMLAVAKIEAVRSAGHLGLAAAASLAADLRSRVQADPTALAALSHVAEPTIRAIGHQIELLDRRLS